MLDISFLSKIDNYMLKIEVACLLRLLKGHVFKNNWGERWLVSALQFTGFDVCSVLF